MIFTEEENEDRAIDTMINPGLRSCANCNWGEGALKAEDRSNDWTTCGHHHQNFKVDSLCAYWTDPKDPRVKKYFKEKYEKIINKR